MKRKRIFVDIDGVLNKWNFDLPSYETLYEEGYFASRPPQSNIIEAVRLLIARGEDVYVLSAVLKDSAYALSEKHDWLDKYLPEVSYKSRIFTICGEDKISYVPAFDPDNDILVDDYGENCTVWANNGGAYVKVSVNADDAAYERSKHVSVIHPDMDPETIADIITGAGNGILKIYHIGYRKSYMDTYDVVARSWKEAVAELGSRIREGSEDGPVTCIESEFVWQGECLKGGASNEEE